MPRTRTDAAERTRQNERLVAEVSAEVGRDVTVREAVAHRKASRGTEKGGGGAHLIKDRPLDLTDETVVHIGTLLAKVEDFRILRGVTASLSLTTSTDFRHLLVDASLLSRADVLVCDLYRMPRHHGLDDDDLDNADSNDGRIG